MLLSQAVNQVAHVGGLPNWRLCSVAPVEAPAFHRPPERGTVA
jgi:hypothetical protein